MGQYDPTFEINVDLCDLYLDQCDSKIYLVKYKWVSDLYFMVH